MLHKVLATALCLFGAVNSFAQNAPASAVKTGEKAVSPEVDYKQAGAPLPRLKLARIPDTSNGKELGHGMRQSSVVPPTSHSRRMKKREKEEEQNNLYITDTQLDNNANLFVMMFNPTCSHCQDETEMVEKNIALFKKSNWVFVANPVMNRYLPDFIKQFHINDFTPFYIGIDSSDFLGKVFQFKALPQINIYDRDRKLIKSYTGEVGIDSLKPYIE
jgi:protein-disulfide isomerase